MDSVKQECDEDYSMDSEDHWLFKWSNDQNNDLVKNEDKKPTTSNIKTEDDFEQNGKNGNEDQWLCEWSNVQNTNLVKKEGKKPSTSNIKTEDVFEQNGKNSNEDQWLFEWSNDQNTDLVKKEDKKPSTSDIKMEADSEQSDKNESGISSRGNGSRNELQTTIDTTNMVGDKNKSRKRTSTLVNRNAKASLKNDKVAYLLESQSFEEVLKHAKVSETVENLCEYQCPKCGKLFRAKRSINYHLLKTKHGSELHKNSNDYLTKIVAHECHICSKRILCDKYIIHCHISKSHKIASTKTYMDKATCLKLVGIKTRNKIEFKDFMDKTKRGQENFTDKVENLCSFLCLHCVYAGNSWKALKRHINQNDHGPLLPLLKYVTNVTYHKCFVCQEVMLCDLDVMRNHQNNKHKISITHYKKIINPTNTSPQQEYLLELKSLIKNIPIVEPRSNRFLEPDALPDQCVTKSSGNLLFFKCNKCCKLNMPFNVLKRHNSSTHYAKTSNYSKESVEEARYHRCHICRKILICDNEFIYIHVKRAHNLTLTMYQTQYVLKSGHLVFPTYLEYLRNKQVLKEFRKVKSLQTTEQCSKQNDNDLILPSMLSSESEDSEKKGSA